MAHPDLDKRAAIVSHGDWAAYELALDPGSLLVLWQKISSYRTLFSDLTKGDLANFIRFVTEPNSVWLELRRDGRLEGIACFVHMEKVVDCEGHIIFLDRDLQGKVEFCKLLARWLFDEFPLQRVTVEVPHFYYTTIRLIKAIGFKQEGERRNAVLINGKWANVSLFGLLRTEVG